MQLLHAAFCVAITTFAAMAFFLVKDKLHFSMATGQKDPYFPLFPILAVIFVVAGQFLFGKQLSALNTSATADEKLVRYQTAFIIRCAFIEAAALLNIVAFMSIGNTVYLAVAAVLLVVFIGFRPTKAGITDLLGLQYPDTEKL